MSQQTATAPATAPFAYGDHVTIAVNVTDFERAIAWYREAFRVRAHLQARRLEVVRSLSTPIAGVHIGLGQTDDDARGGTSPTFQVHPASNEAARPLVTGCAQAVRSWCLPHSGE